MMIVQGLNRELPRRYVAEPQVHLGTAVEIDVATYEEGSAGSQPSGDPDDFGGVATSTWAPPMPTLAIATDLSDMDAYEVRVYDDESGRRLVAAIELVSPANKDRPEARRAFVAKCVALLNEHVCVVIVDVVTTRAANLYRDLLEHFDEAAASSAEGRPALHAVSCRGARREGAWFLETWAHPLALGRPLPTLPLWLAEDHAVPLDLEPSYEETRQVLRIP